MPEERPSGPIPVLVSLLVCDTAATDPSTGKKSLIGIFDRVWVRQFPAQRTITVYGKLTDAEGNYQLKVKFVQTRTGRLVAEAEGEGQFTNRLGSSDFYVELPSLPIPEEGRYEFQILANDIFLGSTFVDAVRRQG